MWTQERLERALFLKKKQLKSAETKLVDARAWTQSGMAIGSREFTISCEKETARIESDINALTEQIKVLEAILDNGN